MHLKPIAVVGRKVAKMPRIRIKAEETVRYCKEMDVDDETLAHFVSAAKSGDRTVDGSDFNLFPEDIEDGRMELDDIEIDVRGKNGKWLSAIRS